MDPRAMQSLLELVTTSQVDALVSNVQCGRIWDPVEARFTRCIVPWIAILPAILIIIIYVGHMLLPLLRPLQPGWTKKFVCEVRDAPPEAWPDSKKRSAWSVLFLSVFGFAGLITQVAAVFLTPTIDSTYVSLLCAWTALTIWTLHFRPCTCSITMLFAYLTLMAAHAIILSQRLVFRLHSYTGSVAIIISALAVITLLVMPLRDQNLPIDGIGSQNKVPSSLQRSPEDNLSLLQFLTVSWLSPMIKLGSSKQLDEDDVWVLPWDFQHTILHRHFRELNGRVTMRLLRANGIDLLLNTFFGTVEIICQLSAPVILQQLLKAMENPDAPRTASVTYAGLILAVRFVGAQAGILNLWFSRRCYERSRGEMITMLYEKTLNRKIIGLKQDDKTGEVEGDGEGVVKPVTEKQSFITRLWNKITRKGGPMVKTDIEDPTKPASMGKILNLMRNDVYEVAQRFWEFPNLFTKPLGFILSVVLVWKIIGWPCLLGIVTVLVAQIINVILARQVLKLERLRRKATDKKLQMTSQFVEAIRHLRWYGWTSSWLSKILDARQVELRLRVIVSVCNEMGIGFLNIYAANLFPVVAFFAYTSLAGQALRIDVAFPALQLFAFLQDSLREIPELFIVLLNAYIAIGRIEQFMQEPNKEDAGQHLVSHVQPSMCQASFSWPGRTELVLDSITLNIPTGLTVVYGKVASGKSALLQAFMGELDKVHGELVQPTGVVGYCAQTPWLQSMSLRDNILFGSPYDEQRYRQVLDACQLTADFADFKSGDLSNIGENGIGLSGGQRARTALARALYSRADTLFLDDPISALDHNTAERLVKACFSGPLTKGRTMILITHRVELCQQYAEQVVEITDGRAQVHDRTELDRAKLLELNRVDSTPAESTTEAQQKAAVPDTFIEDESRAHGGVRLSVYWEYVKAGRLPWWAALMLILAFERLINVALSWFLKQWGEAYDSPQREVWPLRKGGIFGDLPSPEQNIKPWLLVLFLLSTVQSLCFLFIMVAVIFIIYESGRRMFRRIMDRVSHATFRFYDTTPVGRLMNRLTSDITTIDGNISRQLGSVGYIGISWVSSIVVIGSVTPIFLLFAIGLTAAFLYTFSKFLPTSQSLRRLEMVSLSPLMSNFGALLEGLTTVRAFQAQTRFQERVIEVVDTFQKMDHFYWSLQAWLQYRFDILSACSTLILTLLALFTGVSPGLTAFVLVMAEKYVHTTHALCKQYGQLQLEFVAVERIVELLHLDQEPPGTIMPPATWPSFSGDVVFENVTLRYAPHLEPALSNVSLVIKGGSSTAVLGRTGSGKSTLALALLATMAPSSGRILIDGIDIAEVDKQTLRSRVTFIAQDPVLFPGTLRHNLDPTEEHSDEACVDVLRRVASSHDWKLNMEIDAAGKNLSQGQRQLVGLARVILRRSPIVILDEATASIDTGTAMHVQEVLRQEMRESTVITVAHRLEAVRGADYCVVLAKGKVVEKGDAKEMLEGRK